MFLGFIAGNRGFHLQSFLEQLMLMTYILFFYYAQINCILSKFLTYINYLSVKNLLSHQSCRSATPIPSPCWRGWPAHGEDCLSPHCISHSHYGSQAYMHICMQHFLPMCMLAHAICNPLFMMLVNRFHEPHPLIHSKQTKEPKTNLQSDGKYSCQLAIGSTVVIANQIVSLTY